MVSDIKDIDAKEIQEPLCIMEVNGDLYTRITTTH